MVRKRKCKEGLTRELAKRLPPRNAPQRGEGVANLQRHLALRTGIPEEK
jgi:hypothetical protein